MAITFSEYEKLLKKIKKFNYEFICASQFKYFSNTRKLFILNKHDIEKSTKNALKVARIESKLQLKSTYFVQDYLIIKESDISNILKIRDLGHEIGYHYDSLDRFKGNYELAIHDFIQNVNKFLSIGIKIKSICPHGNAAIKRCGWLSNKDLNLRIKEVYGNQIFDLVLDIKNSEKHLKYVSDAGYKFNYINKIWENDPTSTPVNQFINNPIRDSKYSLIISTHTHRFNNNSLIIFVNKLILSVLRRTYKLLKRFKFLNELISKIYFIGKFL
tara:strand:- start:1 stop:816 length:816 start_codon:yes stop_codon:yes gene_type:complete